MKTLQFNCIGIAILLSGSLFSQQISPQVISTSGGFYSNQYGMLSTTTGELAAIETYSSPYHILTQGFQQVWDPGTYITEHPDQDFSFGIYPNPSDGNFDLLTESETSNYITVRILNILGREILKREVYHQRRVNFESFDLSRAAPGIYLVALTVRKNNAPKTENYFVKKIHIVK